MVGEDVDQRAFELLSVGMAEFRGGEFLKMIGKQPRIIDRGQQDKRLAAPARRSGVSNGPASLSRVHSTCASGRAPPSTSSMASRPPERARSSGSCPSGRLANFM